MKKLLTLIASVALLAACSEQSTSSDARVQPVTSTAPAEVGANATCDTVTYMVSLVPAEDYEEENLAKLDKENLVNQLFNSVYSGHATAYEYYPREPLTIDQVKEREVTDPRYSRDKVAVLQFCEEWRFDAEKVAFQKRVISVHIAYSSYDSDGEFMGYRGGIVINMN